jgi:uncharacterized protein (UPF0212 family)
MPRRPNTDLKKIQASTNNTTCPQCGTQIEPKDYKRVDWEHLECPQCGKQFTPGKGYALACGCAFSAIVFGLSSHP